MRKALTFVLIYAALLAALAGCQPGFALNAAAPEGPLPLTGENASRLGTAALTLQQQAGLDQFAIVPVSAETGEAVPDAAPIELGGEIAYAFSRDRSQMAFLSNRTEGCEQYCLRVLDLLAWEEVIQPIPVDKGFSSWFILPEFDSSGAVIPIALNKQTNTASEVLLVDRAQRAVTARVDVPANITKLAVTREGNVAIYGLHTRQDGSGAEAYLALLSGKDLNTLWEQPSPEILFFEGAVDHTDPTQGRYYDPAAAFAPGGDKLFISAADRPVLMTVDFAQRTTSTVPIAPRTGWLERLFGATAAQAKSMNGVSKTGALSQDGRYFFVVGQEYRAVKNDRGEYESERIPMGLQVIDTQDGALVRELDTDAHYISLAPDGSAIFLSGWQENAGGGYEWVELMDTGTWKVSQQIRGYVRPSRLLDGSFAWLAVPTTGGPASEIHLYRPGDREPRSRVTHERYVDWIIVP